MINLCNKLEISISTVTKIGKATQKVD